MRALRVSQILDGESALMVDMPDVYRDELAITTDLDPFCLYLQYGVSPGPSADQLDTISRGDARIEGTCIIDRRS
jgi:hypothetical protein